MHQPQSNLTQTSQISFSRRLTAALLLFFIVTPTASVFVTIGMPDFVVVPFTFFTTFFLVLLGLRHRSLPRTDNETELSHDEALNQLKSLSTADLSPNLFNWQAHVKRGFDIASSALLLLCLSPIILLCALAILFEGDGPIFYLHRTVGRMGKAIDLVKFRTMYVGSESIKEGLFKSSIPRLSNAPIFQFGMMNDPRVTRVGRMLRRMRLDKLPSLWSVLKGDLSLIGPRARTSDEFGTDRIPRRVLIGERPGIFSIAIVIARMRGAPLVQLHELLWDMYYQNNWSILLDIRILWWLLKSFLFNGRPPTLSELVDSRGSGKVLVTKHLPRISGT